MNPELDLIHQVIHLILGRPYFYLRIQQSCRTNQLVDHNTFASLQLILVRRGRHIDRLTCLLFELIELQRPVISCSRQAETVRHQIILPCLIASVHTAYLWHSDVTLVNDEQHIFREIIEQTIGWCARFASVEIPTVVLYARTITQLIQHLEIVLHPLFYTLSV